MPNQITPLQGKVALVTGAAAGLGREIAFALSQAGASVITCDIDHAGLQQTTKQISDMGYNCHAIRCDVSSSQNVAAMFAEIEKLFGTLHVLVNNAAIVPAGPNDEARRNKHYAYLTTPTPRQSLQFTSSMSDEEWHKYWAVNVHGVFYCTRSALKLMEPQREGKIINIASIAGISALSAHSPHYSATKGAVIAFTRSVAAEVAGSNIYVNAIAPGGVMTEKFAAYLSQATEQQRNMLYQLIPLGRIGTAQEYASLVVYLASDGHYLVGQIISPNGGMI